MSLFASIVLLVRVRANTMVFREFYGFIVQFSIL